MTKKYKLPLWALVRSRGNMYLDKPLGRYKTREAALKAVQRHVPGIFALWLQHGDRLVKGSWEELNLSSQKNKP